MGYGNVCLQVMKITRFVFANSDFVKAEELKVMLGSV